MHGIRGTIHDSRNNRILQASKLLLQPQTSGWVGHFDTQNLGPGTNNQSNELFGTGKLVDAPFQDNNSVATAHAVSDLCSVFSVVHK